MRGKENKAPLPAAAKVLSIEGGKEQSYLLDIVVVRLIFAVTLTLVAIYSHPFGFRVRSRLASASLARRESSISNIVSRERR